MNKYIKVVMITLGILIFPSAHAETAKEKLARVVAELPAVAETGWPQNGSFWVFVKYDVPDAYSKQLADLICGIGLKGFVVTVWQGKRQVTKSKCF